VLTKSPARRRAFLFKRGQKYRATRDIFLTACGKAGNYSSHLQTTEQLRAKDEEPV
jgi:hypothetical protein